MQDNQDKERSTDEVQSTTEYNRIPVGTTFSALVQTDPVVHQSSYTIDAVSLSQG